MSTYNVQYFIYYTSPLVTKTSTLKLPPSICPLSDSRNQHCRHPVGLRRLNSITVHSRQVQATYYCPAVEQSRRVCRSAHTAAPEHPRANDRFIYSDATTCGLTRATAVRRANPPPTVLQPSGQAVERRARVRRRTRVGESIIRISRKSIHPERQDKALRCERDTGKK